MKVISTDNETYRLISGDNLAVTDSIPVGTYEISFSMRQGYWLEKREDFTVKTKKVYGNQDKRIDKTMKTFKQRAGNLGVMLSGVKGMGKTLFSKMLAEQAIKSGIPVINLGHNYPGITDFLGSIKQTVMILIDEFEKKFPQESRPDDDNDSQEDFLALLDGTSSTHHLYVTTTNDINNINSYLMNRPGRFYYHFRFNFPEYDEVNDLLHDAIVPKYHPLIKEVQQLTSSVSLNYDALLAIANEINHGYPVKDTLGDLNIQADGASEYYLATVVFKNGARALVTARTSNDEDTIWIGSSDCIKGNPFDGSWGFSLELSEGVPDNTGSLVFTNKDISNMKSDKGKFIFNMSGSSDMPSNGEDESIYPDVKQVILKRKIMDDWSFKRFY